MARKHNETNPPKHIPVWSSPKKRISYGLPSITATKDVEIVIESGSKVTRSRSLQKRPTIEPQLSVLSTDSGILPREIQDSSFVDDVIKDLNSQGISHADLFYQDRLDQCKEKDQDLHVDKVSFHSPESEVCKDDPDVPPAKRKVELPKLPKDLSTRQKNNEASRRSRASRKHHSVAKEEQIACLEAENKRLAILLNDFTSIAASCKQWIVQKMDNDSS